MTSKARTTPSLAAILWLFLRVGCTAWGGFMALIAVVQDRLARASLLDEATVLDTVFLAQVLPGPVAVNFCTAIGWRLRGVAGAAVAWFAVLLPTFVLVVALSVAYFRYGNVPVVARLFRGVTPAIVAVIVAAAWPMARKQIDHPAKAGIAAAAFLAMLVIRSFWTTLAVIGLAAVAGWLLFGTRRLRARSGSALAFAPLAPVWLFAWEPALALQLMLTFAVASLTLFGSGYVFIPEIERVVVDHGWLTHRQFVDGIAISQITPGPILIAAAFVGYKVAGLLGAALGTLGMFVPPALLTLLAVRGLEAIKASRDVKAALGGLRPAVVGLLLAAAVTIAIAGPWGPITSSAICLAALVALLRFKVDVALVIPGAAAIGYVLPFR
jgi:chromate transporter